MRSLGFQGRAMVLTLSLSVGACAGFGVVETSDPATKLSDAADLFERQGRPLLAEKLIREAIVIYEKNGDEIGLADAYRTYGFFFRSPSIRKWGRYYREHGFLDKSASIDLNLPKSIEYFEKAANIFARHRRFDALTNVNLNIGLTRIALGEQSAACEAFERSLRSNRDNLRENPNAKPAPPRHFSTYDEYIARVKKDYGCT
jgi:tetratricopeptide (TPR) repeat protein